MTASNLIRFGFGSLSLRYAHLLPFGTSLFQASSGYFSREQPERVVHLSVQLAVDGCSSSTKGLGVALEVALERRNTKNVQKRVGLSGKHILYNIIHVLFKYI